MPEKLFTIHRFNLLNLRNGSQNDMVIEMQEILYYAESRFWSILIDITSKADRNLQWYQQLLHRELVSFISQHSLKL